MTRRWFWQHGCIRDIKILCEPLTTVALGCTHPTKLMSVEHLFDIRHYYHINSDNSRLLYYSPLSNAAGSFVQDMVEDKLWPRHCPPILHKLNQHLSRNRIFYWGRKPLNVVCTLSFVVTTWRICFAGPRLRFGIFRALLTTDPSTSYSNWEGVAAAAFAALDLIVKCEWGDMRQSTVLRSGWMIPILTRHLIYPHCFSEVDSW